MTTAKLDRRPTRTPTMKHLARRVAQAGAEADLSPKFRDRDCDCDMIGRPERFTYGRPVNVGHQSALPARGGHRNCKPLSICGTPATGCRAARQAREPDSSRRWSVLAAEVLMTGVSAPRPL